MHHRLTPSMAMVVYRTYFQCHRFRVCAPLALVKKTAGKLDRPQGCALSCLLPGNTSGVRLTLPLGSISESVTSKNKRGERNQTVALERRCRDLSIDVFYAPILCFILICSPHPLSSHFSFPFALPTRSSDPASLSRLFSPVPTTVRALVFFPRRLQSFLPSSSRIESRTIQLTRCRENQIGKSAEGGEVLPCMRATWYQVYGTEILFSMYSNKLQRISLRSTVEYRHM